MIKVDYAVQESLTNIRRNFFMTFAAVMVVAISLLLLGGVMLVNGSISRTARVLVGNVRVSVFLVGDKGQGLSSDERDSLEKELRQMPEVKSVTFETRAQAYAHFRKLFANQPEIANNVSPDALPESFRIQLNDPKKFTVIKDRLDNRPGIKVVDQREVVKRLFSFGDLLRRFALGVAALVLIAALLLIATTIRMAIYARRKEIGIMKLVGATNWFIRIPFMLEGIVQGAIGAVIAIVLLVGAKIFVFGNLVQQNELFQLPLKFTVTWGDLGIYGIYLLAFGIVIGAIGSVFGLRRFLDV